MFAAVGIFFASFFILLIFTTAGYYLFYNCSWLSSGAPARLQSPLLILDGLVVCLCFSILAALVGMLIYFVQHRPPFLHQCILWTIFVFVVFFVFIPCFSFFESRLSVYVRLSSENKQVYVEQFQGMLISAGFFRDLPSGTLYLTRVDDSARTVSGILFWNQVPGMNIRGSELLRNDSVTYQALSSIPDPLISQTLVMPEYNRVLLGAVKTLMNTCSEIFTSPESWFSAQAWKSYLLFLTMLPSVWALFVFSRFSSWKPLNMLLLPVLFLSVLYVNFLAQCSDRFFETVNNLLPLSGGRLLLSLLLNAAFFVCVGVSGLVRMLIGSKHPGYRL